LKVESIVIPAKAGIQEKIKTSHWIPAFAGMTGNEYYPLKQEKKQGWGEILNIKY